MKTSMMNRILFASVCSFAITGTAFAQAADEEDDGSEIVVTAQNREQKVNDVPIVMDVVGAEELKASGFASMNDIDKIAPVVQVNQDQGTVKVTVRGVGTNDGGEAQDTSVVINIDGEYLNRPNVIAMGLFDMERVEVLRGPQGTLYGRNSTGGAINFITRKPGKDFGVNANASYGNYNSLRIDGGVDVPLGGIAGVRVAGFYENRDGYVSHPAGGGFAFFPAFAAGRSDDMDAYGGRVSLRLDPSDQLTVDLSAEYSERKFTPSPFAYVDFNRPGNAPTGPGCNAPGFERVAPAFAQTLCFPSGTNYLPTINRENYVAPGFGLGFVGQESWAIRGRLAYEISDAATITYTGGYRDFSGDPRTKLTLPVVYQSFTFQDEARTQSHELRLNGEIGGVVYQVGGFYFKEKQDREPAFFIRPIGPNGSFLTYFGRYITSDSKSLFGQVEVPLGETLTAVGGLRYTDNKRKALYINGSPFATFAADGVTRIPGPPNPALFSTGPSRKDVNAINAQKLNLGNSENKTTWLVGLNFKPNPDTLVYAKVATGFKGGGFDAVGAYAPETNMAIEGGWETDLRQ
jgi:iron complex outermembrane recepter protein